MIEEDLGSVDLITLIMRGMVPWCLRLQLVSTRPTNWNNGYTSIGDEIHSENHVFLSMVKLPFKQLCLESRTALLDSDYTTRNTNICDIHRAAIVNVLAIFKSMEYKLRAIRAKISTARPC